MFKYYDNIWFKQAFIKVIIEADDYDQAHDLAKAFYPAADDIFVYGAE